MGFERQIEKLMHAVEVLGEKASTYMEQMAAENELLRARVLILELDLQVEIARTEELGGGAHASLLARTRELEFQLCQIQSAFARFEAAHVWPPVLPDHVRRALDMLRAAMRGD